jgi:hypothetical protein
MYKVIFVFLKRISVTNTYMPALAKEFLRMIFMRGAH